MSGSATRILGLLGRAFRWWLRGYELSYYLREEEQMDEIDQIETDNATFGMGRTACLAYKGARTIGTQVEALFSAAALLVAIIHQPAPEEIPDE